MSSGVVTRSLVLIFGLLLVVSCAGMGEIYAPEVARMDKEAVNASIGTDGFHLIDARYGKDWSYSKLKIARAVREDPHEISSWAGNYAKADTIVVYCA